MADAAAGADERLKVFLSYSRTDMAVADRLVVALEAAGFAVMIDRRDLPYGEAWQAELADFIRASDTVVWLVSGASVQSRWCNWELGEVQRINKRLVPVAIEAVPPEAMPEALGRIHVLPAEGGFDFGRDLPKLVEALNTDRVWLKEHTRLADRARQWQVRDRSSALLLRGLALKDAQAWADRKPRAAPAPSDDISQLLIASRHAQSQRQRTTVAGSIAAAVIGLGLAGVATWQWREADVQRAEAERNFETARGTVDGIVFDMARGLREVEGMRVESVRRILEQTRAAVDRLAETAPENQQLLRTRMVMLMEFATAYRAAGDTTAAAAAFDEAKAIAARLSAANPDAAGPLADMAVTLDGAGDVARARGDLAGALSSFEASLAIQERLAAADPGNGDRQRALSVAYDKIGNVRLRQGDLAEALSSYEASLAIRERLAASAPDDAAAQRDLMVSHEKVAGVQATQGNLADAVARYEASLAIAERLAASDPGNTTWQRDLSAQSMKAGDARVLQGDLAGALSNYEASLAIAERLAASDSGNVNWQRDVSVRRTKIGEVREAGGDLAAALADYEAALAITERLAAADPANTNMQRDVSVRHIKIGDVREREMEYRAALSSYQTALVVMEQLTAIDPSDTAWQRDVSVIHSRIGDVQKAMGDHAEALVSYEASLAIDERLAAADPTNARLQRDLSISHDSIGSLYDKLGNLAEVLARREASLAILERLAAEDPANARAQTELSETLNGVAWMLAVRAPESLRDGARAVSLSTRANEITGWKDGRNLDTLAAAYARIGDFAEAARWQEQALADASYAAEDPDARQRLVSYQAGKPWPPEDDAADPSAELPAVATRDNTSPTP